MDNVFILGRTTAPGGATTASSEATPPRDGARPAALYALAGTLLLALTGCATTEPYYIDVDSEIPDPLIEPVPITVGVHYTPEFSAFQPEEESLLGDVYVIRFGDLQQRYFHAMLEAAFERVVITDSADPEAIKRNAVDVFVVPRAENFSFLTPEESGSKFFAVSMRHYIEFYRADGSPFGTWEINSYGRSRDSFAAKNTRLAEEACRDAMRDMATSVIVGLPEQLRNRGMEPETAAAESN